MIEVVGAIRRMGRLCGALAMVLALALPPDFPHRVLLTDMTFGVSSGG